MKYSISICFVFLFAVLGFSQDCEVCIGEDVQLTSNLNSNATPITYSWVCTNGFSSNLASPLVPNVTTNTTCTLNAIDATNCTFTEDLVIEVFSNPTIVIAVEDCNVVFFDVDAMGQNCTTYEVQRLSGSTWIVESTSLPYTATVDGDYRVVYDCECGDVITNTVAVVNCTPCSPFTIIDFGDCDIVITGSAPCGAGGYEVWANIDAGQTCSPDTPPCDESSMTQVGTTGGSSFFALSSDGCYQYRCTSGSVDYCSNILCFEDDCETGCNDALTFTTMPSNPDCTPFNSINWPCSGVGDWTITEGPNTIQSGTNSPPSNITFTYDATYVFTMNCNDGCVYSNSYTVSGCGSPPCDPPSTLNIINNNCTLTALVSNCDGAPSYSWSTSQTSSSITVTSDGTYTVTVTGCCVDPLIQSITVVCTDPCDGFSASISGDLVLCDGDIETYTAIVSNGNPPFSYSWVLNGTAVSTSPSYVYTHDGNTNTLILTVTDSEGCIDIVSVFIVEGTDCCTDLLLQIGGSGIAETVTCSVLEIHPAYFGNQFMCECPDNIITINYDYEITVNNAITESGNQSTALTNGGANTLPIPWDICDYSSGDQIVFDYTNITDDTDCFINISGSGGFVFNVTQQQLDDCSCP